MTASKGKEDTMRRSEVEILEDDLDDIPALTRTELGLPIDLTRDELDEDGDDLGFRALYENPDTVIRSSRWPDAA
jgi:hypothetical protein